MPGRLNDNQKRRLVATFEHVDQLLTEVLHVLSSAETPSPFQQHLADSLPIQRRVLSDYVAQLRGMMVRILTSQGIAVPKPQISSLWAFRTVLLGAKIAVEGLTPKCMRGYGDLSDEAAHGLEVLTTQLMDVLDRMSSYLAQGAGQELQARLERVEKTTREVEWAKLLVEVITAHGLVELRPSLDAVVERLESNRFEVAVFGRVSSGKSSLLDYVLQTDVLPVGVTPVTALPTRVVFGPRSLARIWFAEARPIVIEPRELRQYATEQGNPENAKHVTRIQVELPIDRLKEGVTFVDTPGLGSLARYGEMEAMAYLPRCDLGVVLVGANSTFTHEDAFVVNALCQVGVKVMVLLTKADMLTSDERATASQYIQEQLRANVGVDLPVHIISVKGRDAKLCDRWFETTLVPCLLEHQNLARASLRRKVGLLRDAAVSVLQRRLNKGSVAGGDKAVQWAAVEPSLNEALTRLDVAIRERLEWSGLGEKILDAAAQKTTEKWRSDRVQQADATEAIISCGNPEVARLASEVAKALVLLRGNLTNILQAAASAAGLRQDEDDNIPMISGMHVLDLSAYLRETPLRRPGLAVFSKSMAYRNTRRQLAERIGHGLTDLLDKYVRQIEQWRLQTLAEMRQVFAMRANFYRIHCEQTSNISDLTSIEKDLCRLQSLQDDGEAL
jgi:GTP-binding protein EngB required for normal cell division